MRNLEQNIEEISKCKTSKLCEKGDRPSKSAPSGSVEKKNCFSFVSDNIVAPDLSNGDRPLKSISIENKKFQVLT